MTDGPAPNGGLRLDKWLWQARFAKTRGLAARLCESKAIRCGGAPVAKAHHLVRPGDVLTFLQGRHIRVIKVLALGTRRGPAPEARTLYEDLDPPPELPAAPAAQAVEPESVRSDPPD